MASSTGCTLLTLPPEILQEIFSYLLPYSTEWNQQAVNDKQIVVWQARHGSTGLLTVNRIISEIALSYLYGKNTFILTVSCCNTERPLAYFEFYGYPEHTRPGAFPTCLKFVQAYYPMTTKNIERMRNVHISIQLELSCRKILDGKRSINAQHVCRLINRCLMKQVFATKAITRHCHKMTSTQIKLHIDVDNSARDYNGGLFVLRPCRDWVLEPAENALMQFAALENRDIEIRRDKQRSAYPHHMQWTCEFLK